MPPQPKKSNPPIKSTPLESSGAPQLPDQAGADRREFERTKEIFSRSTMMKVAYGRNSDSDQDKFRKHLGINNEQDYNRAQKEAAPSHPDYQGPNKGQKPVDPRLDLSDTPSWTKPKTVENYGDNIPKSKGGAKDYGNYLKDRGIKDPTQLSEGARQGLKQVDRGKDAVKKAKETADRAKAAIELAEKAAVAVRNAWTAIATSEVWGPVLFAILGILAVVITIVISTMLISLFSFYITGNSGYSGEQTDVASQQITPYNDISGIAPGAQTLANPEGWYRAQPSGTGQCQCASMAMIMTFLGKPKTSEQVCSDGGGEFLDYRKAASANGFSYIALCDDHNNPNNDFNQFIKSIQTSIDKGKPVVIGVGNQANKALTGSTHFMAVYDYTNEGVKVNDPGGNFTDITYDLLKQTPFIEEGREFYYAYTLNYNN